MNVLRGGAWNNNRDNCRCAYRNYNHPMNRNDNIGFRCASTCETPESLFLRKKGVCTSKVQVLFQCRSFQEDRTNYM